MAKKIHKTITYSVGMVDGALRIEIKGLPVELPRDEELVRGCIQGIVTFIIQTIEGLEVESMQDFRIDKKQHNNKDIN